MLKSSNNCASALSKAEIKKVIKKLGKRKNNRKVRHAIDEFFTLVGMPLLL